MLHGSITRTVLFAAISLIAAFAASAQPVTIDVGSRIHGALGNYNAAGWLATGLTPAQVNFVQNGVLKGDVDHGTIGGVFTVQNDNVVLNVGLMVTYTLSMTSDGKIVINYNAVSGLLQASGSIITGYSAKALPGYGSGGSGSGGSGSGGSGSGGSGGSGGGGGGSTTQAPPPPNTTPANFMTNQSYQDSITATSGENANEGTVSVGPITVVDWYYSE